MAAINNCCCCGVREIYALSVYLSPKKSMLDICLKFKLGADGGCGCAECLKEYPPGTLLKPGCGALLFFTEAHVKGPATKYGKTFADFIVANSLGTLTQAAAFTNPNTKNLITTWFWVVDWAALEAWYQQETKK